MDSVQRGLTPFLERARRRALGVGVCVGAMVGSAALGTCLLIGRFTAFPSLAVGGILCVGAASLGGWVGRRRLPADETLVSQVDKHFGLYARLRTAWELEAKGNTSPFASAQRDDAVHHLSGCSPEGWIPRLLPRWVWIAPTAFLLAWTPLLFPPCFSVSEPMTAAEHQAVRDAVKALDANPVTPELKNAKSRLERAKTTQEALAALADAEHELRKRALTEAGIPPDAPDLADVLAASGQNLPPELRERLKALREKSGGNSRTAALNSLLERIETKAVSAETLARILQELRNLESNANPDLARALAEIREQKKAIALAAVDAQRRGNLARLDEVAGKESGEGVAEGTRLNLPTTENTQPTTLALESLKSASNREMKVFSREASAPPGEEGMLLPFRHVVLSGQKAADIAIRNKSLPVTYRTRIQAYFDALSK